MRVFLLDLKVLSSINKKEEITDQTYFVTDAEAETIKLALEKGCHFKGENGQLIISDVKPREYYDFDEESWKWVINKDRYNEYATNLKEDLWEKIKQRREESLSQGLYIESIKKWFHTDQISQLSYTRAKEYFSIKPNEKIHWKTMDGTFINLDSKLLDDIIISIFEQSQKIFHNAEKHRMIIDKASVDELEKYDVNTGWPTKLETNK